MCHNRCADTNDNNLDWVKVHHVPGTIWGALHGCFKPHPSLAKQAFLLSSPFYRWRHWSKEGCTNWFKAIPPGIWIQTLCGVLPLHHHTGCSYRGNGDVLSQLLEFTFYEQAHHLCASISLLGEMALHTVIYPQQFASWRKAKMCLESLSTAYTLGKQISSKVQLPH